jgi:hypothetical protein
MSQIQMAKAAALVAVLLCMVLVTAAQTPQEPHSFFKKQIGLSDDQIGLIARGKAVAKVLPSKTPAEILIFGAVYVNATPEEYVKLAFDMDRLRRLPKLPGCRPAQRSPEALGSGGFHAGT